MAAPESRAVPCEISHQDWYQEDEAVHIFQDEDRACLLITGMDSVVELFFDLDALGHLIDGLTAVEESISEGGGDGDTDCDGVGGKYTGVDHLAAASGSDAD